MKANTSEDQGPVRVAIIGGGAAAFFAAIACAEANSQAEVSIFERAGQFLSKVKISGGGRCNVTHACFDNRIMAEHYPRGQRALISLLHRFAPSDTVSWFRERGVSLKVEPDGRMFPVTDASQTIIDCFLGEADRLGIRLQTRTNVDSVRPLQGGGFQLSLSSRTIDCEKLLVATGGCRSPGAIELLRSLGHEVVPPVPSLFSFHIEAEWLRALAGISMPAIEVSLSGTKLRESGAVLVTHVGLSGPVILRLSAWGARALYDLNYHFDIRINWLPRTTEDELRKEFRSLRESHPNRHVLTSPMDSMPSRLWAGLAVQSGVDSNTRWTTLSRTHINSLVENLLRTKLHVSGKSLNKEEFVTCGGVKLRQLDFKTMQSRLTPGLFFAGEVLDIDGITGGFNFQAAWTTGWIAGKAMAANR